MKKTYMTFLALCLVGGILALVITRPNSTQSNEVAECSDVTVSPDDEVIIEHVKDSLNLSLSEPEEVTSEPEEEIEEPQEPKIDTVRSPDGRYYMVFPIEDDKSSAGVYDSRTGKLYRTFEVDEELCYYDFVENQDYLIWKFGIDGNQGFFAVINIKDSSKDGGGEYYPCIHTSSTGRYIAYRPGIWMWNELNESEDKKPSVIVFDTGTGTNVLKTYAKSEVFYCDGLDFICDADREYLLVSYKCREKGNENEIYEFLEVYDTNTWQLINTIPIDIYYCWSDGFEIECKNGCIWDDVTEKYYKLDPRR